MKTYQLADPFVKVHNLVRRWARDVSSEEYSGVWSCDHEIENIENRHVSGFVPFTDGGVDVVIPASMSYCDSSGSCPNAIQPYLDAARKDCEDEWDSQNPEHTVEWIYSETPPQGDLLDPKAAQAEKDRWREKYFDFEQEWMSEGETFFYKVRAIYHGDEHRSESGEPEILFCVGINTDFEYGRDHIAWLSCYGGDPQCTKWVWEATVKAADLTEDLIEEMKKSAIDALYST